jgi:uncharacterized membrane protein
MRDHAPPPEDATTEEVYARRRERFNAVLEEFRCQLTDWSVQVSADLAPRTVGHLLTTEDPVAEHLVKLGRWALVLEEDFDNGYFVRNLSERASIEAIAAVEMEERRRTPHCLIDLDGDPDALCYYLAATRVVVAFNTVADTSYGERRIEPIPDDQAVCRHVPAREETG